jgi:heme/copper-type cytochrome/quinol oxidase subunit 2
VTIFLWILGIYLVVAFIVFIYLCNEDYKIYEIDRTYKINVEDNFKLGITWLPILILILFALWLFKDEGSF